MSGALTRRAAVYAAFFVSLALLLALGNWQWRRGVEKETLDKTLAAAGDYTTLDRAPPDWSELAWRRARLQGDWLGGRDFLLANRIHQSRAGYEVLTPYRLRDGAVLLVNRGWLAADASPAAPQVPGLATAAVRGQLYLPQKGFTLGAAHHPPPAGAPPWPKVIQYFDAAALAAALGVAVQPAVLVLDPVHPAAYTPVWQPYATPAARHYAYAAQWWGLAATLLVFGFIWRRRA